MTGRPLEGVRILAVEQFGAGPYGTMALADLGAEVIKIEDPTTRGDVSRTVPPYRLTETDSIYFQALNRNKKSLVLDIRPREGREIFHRLVKVSDAVYNNLRGDVPRKIGITYDALKAVNPKIVCCSLTGFGMTGPRAAEPGYDYLMQGYAGLMSITGEPGAPPAKFGVSVIDLCGGYVSALGLAAGVIRARATGLGCDVDVGLLDTAVSLLNYLGVWHLNRGYLPTKLADSAHASLVPSQVFPTRDGHIIVMCFKEKFWQELCEILGAPELADDPRFKTFDVRLLVFPKPGARRDGVSPSAAANGDRERWEKFLKAQEAKESDMRQALGTLRVSEWLKAKPGRTLAQAEKIVIETMNPF